MPLQSPIPFCLRLRYFKLKIIIIIIIINLYLRFTDMGETELVDRFRECLTNLFDHSEKWNILSKSWDKYCV